MRGFSFLLSLIVTIYSYAAPKIQYNLGWFYVSYLNRYPLNKVVTYMPTDATRKNGSCKIVGATRELLHDPVLQSYMLMSFN